MIPLCTLTLFGAVAAAPLANGDFGRGLEGWGTQNSWYERPQGAGLAQVLVAEKEGHQGGAALKIVARDNRNLALQSLPAYPGRYRVTGWIRCQGIQPGEAGVLVEWLDGKEKWLRGDWAVRVSGTRPWQSFDAIVEAPPTTRSAHFDLIATEPNRGTVWFDHVGFERLASGFPVPQAPEVQAATPPGGDGYLEIHWDPARLTAGTCRLLLYCQPDEAAALGDQPPSLLADSQEGRAVIGSLETGRRYSLAARAVNADGQASPLGPVIRATVADRQPPRPGSIDARRAARPGEVVVGWSPHLLDDDVATVHVVAPAATVLPTAPAATGLATAPGATGSATAPGATGSASAPGQSVQIAGSNPRAPSGIRELAAIDAGPLYAVARPFYCTSPWAEVRVALPAGARIGVWCEDRHGNRGEVGWTEIRAARSPGGAGAARETAPFALWAVPPTDQVRRDAPPPPVASSSAQARLVLLTGQDKGFQLLLRPQAVLHRVRVALAPLVHDDGASRIDRRWLAYHFVNYVRIEKNSRATPAEELVWPAPAEYPDELGEDLQRDLPAASIQPIYIRVTGPRDARPGRYRGRGRIVCDEGMRDFEITVRVSPVALPESLRLKLVYWFSWDDPCKRWGVERSSADGWRVLARLSELMRAHHQNAVVVPWDLVRSWQKPDGSLVHDFREFDRYIETFRARGVDRLFCLSHVGGRSTEEWECPTMCSHRHTVRRLESGEPESIDALELLPALERHLADAGLLDRFAVHVADEPIAKNLASYRQLSAKVRRAAPRLRRIDAVHVPDLQGALEIWVPQLNYFQQWLDRYRAAQRNGDEVWFYIAWVPQGHYPNRMIDSQAVKPRVLHWLGAIYQTSGYLHWALNQWQIPLSSLGSPGDQYIVWPSRRWVANSSLRYEAEREGLEDGELFFQLRAALERRGLSAAEAQKECERITRQAVRGFEDYTRDWRQLEKARGLLLDRLEQESGK
jgi:hypothetical protein